VIPPCNRKSMAGNPPPTVRAPVLDPTVKINPASHRAAQVADGYMGQTGFSSDPPTDTFNLPYQISGESCQFSKQVFVTPK
jgi:hypothetical protein